MKKIFYLFFIQLSIFNYSNAQVFDVDTIQYNGDINKCLNIVIMGDGYTALEQASFITTATNLTNQLFFKSPWYNYQNYFNVFAIKVISNESGAKHPNTASDCNTAFPAVPVADPDNYFGSSFDVAGIHRLIVAENETNINNVLAANFPSYDAVVIIANTPYYGGSGGWYATITTDASGGETIAHELGHTFGLLADEYYAGDAYFNEKPNMTQQTDPTSVKWRNWLGYNGTGIDQYCCGGNSALWYKPSTTCKMEALNNQYCSVCRQSIIENIHATVSPIVSYFPTTSTVIPSQRYIDFKLTKMLKPIPNTLKRTWKLDGVTINNNVDSINIDIAPLTNGSHTVTVSVEDTTQFIRVDNHSTVHLNVVTWSINMTTAGIDVISNENNISCSIYPNPSSSILNIAVQLEKNSKLSIQLVSLEGKIIKQLANENSVSGEYLKSYNIDDLAKGTYIIQFKIGEISHTQTFVKE